MTRRVGILGLGMDAPAEVRTNEWWPPDLVARWAADRAARPRPELPAQLTPGMRRVLAAASAFGEDPFQGVVERRVLAAGESHLDSEERAAREAIARAGIRPGAIDLVLTHAVVPEYQLTNPACPLHERLGLARECLAMLVEATAYTVFGQLALAEAAILAGRARCALLVQSCTGSRLVDKANPLSVVVGDAATAVVVGPVEGDRGVLAMTHYTDGRYPRSLVLDGDRLIADSQQLFEAQLHTADVCKDSVDAALRRSGHTIAHTDFLSVFQGTAWLQQAVAAHLGADRARSVEVFRRFGYLSSAAVPASLYIGERDGHLGDGALVVLTGGGTGMTYGAAVLRWCSS